MKHMILLTLCLLCMCMPAAGSMAEPAQNLPATIDGGDADRVHLRAKPSIQSESLGLYYTGTALSCESDPTQEWTKVVIGAQEGYVKSEYLRWGDDSKNVQSQQPQGTIKANGWVNMRSAPSKEAQIKTKLYEGDAVSILGETDSLWYLVATPQAIGYVWSNHIQLQNHSLRYNPLGSTDELSFEFGQLAFHYGDSFSAIMKKANDAGYVFECLGPHKIYHYDIYDEENFISNSRETVIDVKVDVVEKLGAETLLYCIFANESAVDDSVKSLVDAGAQLTAKVDSRSKTERDQVIELAIDIMHSHLFDKETELTILKGEGQPAYVPVVELQRRAERAAEAANAPEKAPSKIGNFFGKMGKKKDKEDK